MRVVVKHEPKEGVLCWGGPKHGEVVPITRPRDVMLFPLPPRLTAVGPPSVEEASPSLAVQSVEYRMGWFAFRDEMWPVLMYPENLERHRQRLEQVANFVAYLAKFGLAA